MDFDLSMLDGLYSSKALNRFAERAYLNVSPEVLQHNLFFGAEQLLFQLGGEKNTESIAQFVENRLGAGEGNGLACRHAGFIQKRDDDEFVYNLLDPSFRNGLAAAIDAPTQYAPMESDVYSLAFASPRHEWDKGNGVSYKLSLISADLPEVDLFLGAISRVRVFHGKVTPNKDGVAVELALYAGSKESLVIDEVLKADARFQMDMIDWRMQQAKTDADKRWYFTTREFLELARGNRFILESLVNSKFAQYLS